MTHPRKLQVEGRLQVIEMTGAWGAYAGGADHDRTRRQFSG
jgi:hypothetical protein